MKKNLLFILVALPLISFSQSCPDISASSIASDNGLLGDTLRVCFGQEIYLKDNGSFHQNAGTLQGFRFELNGNQIGALSSQNDSVSYTVNQDGITEIKYYVTDNNGCESAPYSIFLIAHQPEVNFDSYYQTCEGDSLHLSFDPSSQDASYEFSRFESNQLECMSDNGTQTFSLNVSGITPANIASGADINFIRLAMEHNRIGELEIQVECPNGQTATLMAAGTGQFEDFGDPVWGNGAPAVDCNDFTTIGEHYDYNFTESAWRTIEDYVANPGGNIPAGNYEPVDAYSNFVGCPTNGVWTLSITDAVAGNDGSIGNFAIDFNSASTNIQVGTSVDFTFGANDSYWSTSDNYTYLSSDLDTLIYANGQTGINDYVYHLIDDQSCEYAFDVQYELFDLPILSAGADGTFCEGTNLNGIIANVATDCFYELHFYDSYGDGWNGSSIDITTSGNTVNYGMTSGDYLFQTVSLVSGSDIEITFNNSGNWAEECSFYVVLGADTIYSDGLGGTEPTTSGVLFNIDCVGASLYWTPDNGILSDVNSLEPAVNALGNHEFVLHYDNVNFPACSVTDTVLISINENPEIQDTSFSGCHDDVLVVNPSPTGGMAPYSENWYGENPANLTNGQYLYTVTDANSCSDSKIITVQKSDSMYFSNIQLTNVSCFGEEDGTLYFLFNGGISPVSFDWGTVNNFNQIPAGTHLLIATDSLGCKDTLEYSVTEPNEILVSGVVTDVQTQNDGSIDITATGGTGSQLTYSWSNGETTEDISGLPGGDFILTVTDSIGCTEIDTFTVVDPFLGIDDDGAVNFVAYPNPTSDFVKIEFTKTVGDFTIEVYDLKGVLLERQTLNGLTNFQLNLSTYPNGSYLIRMQSEAVNQVFKIEKQ